MLCWGPIVAGWRLHRPSLKGDRAKWFSLWSLFVFTQQLPKDFVLVLSVRWAQSGLEMPNREWCWGCLCCRLRLEMGAGHALGPKAFLEVSVLRGLALSSERPSPDSRQKSRILSMNPESRQNPESSILFNTIFNMYLSEVNYELYSVTP